MKPHPKVATASEPRGVRVRLKHTTARSTHRTVQQKVAELPQDLRQVCVACLAGRDRALRLRRTQHLRIEILPWGDMQVVREDPSSGQEARDVERRNPRLHGALEAARSRGRARVAEIMRREEMMNADAFAALLGTTRATVNSKRARRILLGLQGTTRGFRFPSWQVGDDGRPFDAIPELFNRLGDDPWTVYRFLVQRHPELNGRAAIDALRAGQSEQVIATAENAARSFS